MIGQGADLEAIVMRRSEGTEFRLTMHAPPSSEAPTILVVPAMGMRAGYYTPLLTALHEAGFGAGATELRGHEVQGGRRPGRSYDAGYFELVDDLRGAVEAVTSRVGSAPYLLGHSLGAQISCAFAARRPEAVAGLVLIAAGSVHWRLWSFRHLLLTQSFAGMAQILGHFPGDRLGFGGREPRSQMADWARFARTGRLQFGSPPYDHTEDLARLRIPILAISLKGDTLAPARSVDGLTALMPRADVTHHHLVPAEESAERVDHIRWVRSPATVIPTVKDWLTDRARDI